MARLAILALVFSIFAGCTNDESDEKQESSKDVNRRHSGSESRDASTNIDLDLARANLETQAKELGEAVLRKDHQTLTLMTNVAVVAGVGGDEAFINQVESVALDLERQGYRIIGYEVDEVSDLVLAKARLYAIVRNTIRMSGPKGIVVETPGFLIASSSDQGEIWFFLDGEGVRGGREELKNLLPDFPVELPLPAPSFPTVHESR